MYILEYILGLHSSFASDNCTWCRKWNPTARTRGSGEDICFATSFHIAWMTSNAQDPNEEIIEESSTPSTLVTSPPTAAVETSSSTSSIQTDNPQSGSVKMAAANFYFPPPAKFDLACEQALLFGRAKRVSRERASASPAQAGELARRLSFIPK